MKPYLILLLACLAPWAQADDAGDLERLLKPLKTLKGDFEQSVQDKNGKVLQVTEGRFAIKRPGFFLWESEEPYPQLIVGSPEELWVYDPDLEQATLQKQGDYEGFNPSQLLSGYVDQLAKDFVVSQQTAKDVTVFTLEPREEGGQYSQIELRFEGEKPQSFTFADQLNQSTEVRFDALTLNPKLEDDLFEFTPPPGTDVATNE